MKYISNRFDKYFESRGIKVRFNGLGFNRETVASYIKESYPDHAQSGSHSSESVKDKVYQRFFDFKKRTKYTGFENVEKLENPWRQKNIDKVNIDDDNDDDTRTYSINPNATSYIDNAIMSLKTLENPMVFYSGGIDSELVLNCFNLAGIKCKVVIFEYTDLQGNILNQHDLDNAYEYCQNHNINPIVKRLCLQSLWNTDIFMELAADLRFISPQHTTYAYMVHLISQEYPNHTYIFGGEIRYINNPMDSSNQSVLVHSFKVATRDILAYVDANLGSFIKYGVGGGNGRNYSYNDFPARRVSNFTSTFNWANTGHPANMSSFHTNIGFATGATGSSPWAQCDSTAPTPVPLHADQYYGTWAGDQNSETIPGGNRFGCVASCKVYQRDYRLQTQSRIFTGHTGGNEGVWTGMAMIPGRWYMLVKRWRADYNQIRYPLPSGTFGLQLIEGEGNYNFPIPRPHTAYNASTNTATFHPNYQSYNGWWYNGGAVQWIFNTGDSELNLGWWTEEPAIDQYGYYAGYNVLSIGPLYSSTPRVYLIFARY